MQYIMTELTEPRSFARNHHLYEVRGKLTFWEYCNLMWKTICISDASSLIALKIEDFYQYVQQIRAHSVFLVYLLGNISESQITVLSHLQYLVSR